MDRISRLPDEILQHILTLLPTKYAVGTSVLSSRWLDLWLPLPVLDFDDSLYLNPRSERPLGNSRWHKSLFRDFVDVVLSVNHSPNLSKFRLSIHIENGEELCDVNEWIEVVMQRDVVELDISITGTCISDVEDPLIIPPCQSLQVLRIKSFFGFSMPTSTGCFPNLRVFDFQGDFESVEREVTENLIPSLPRLERLKLSAGITSEMDSISFNITGTALKDIEVDLWEEPDPIYEDQYDFENDECDVKVVIDAPCLEFLHLKDMFLVDYSVKDLPPNCEVKLDVNLVQVEDYISYEIGDYEYGFDLVDVPFGAYYPNESSIQLMQEISNAKSLSVSSATTRALMNATEKNLPIFHLLTKLDVTLHVRGWNLFLQWLHSCPDLQFLVLRKQNYADEISTEDEWTAPDSVPTCVLLHLKEVEIIGLRKEEKDKVMEYLRANAKVLQKITVDSQISS